MMRAVVWWLAAVAVAPVVAEMDIGWSSEWDDGMTSISAWGHNASLANVSTFHLYVGDSVGRNLYRAKDMHPATVHSRCIVPLEIARYAHGLAPQPVVSLSYTMLGGMRVARNDTQCCGEGYKKSCSRIHYTTNETRTCLAPQGKHRATGDFGGVEEIRRFCCAVRPLSTTGPRSDCPPRALYTSDGLPESVMSKDLDGIVPSESTMLEIVVALGRNDMKDRFYYMCECPEGRNCSSHHVRTSALCSPDSTPEARRAAFYTMMLDSYREVVATVHGFCGNNTNLLIAPPADLNLRGYFDTVEKTVDGRVLNIPTGGLWEYKFALAVGGDDRYGALIDAAETAVAEAQQYSPGLITQMVQFPPQDPAWARVPYSDGSHFTDPLSCGTVAAAVGCSIARMRQMRDMGVSSLTNPSSSCSSSRLVRRSDTNLTSGVPIAQCFSTNTTTYIAAADFERVAYLRQEAQIADELEAGAGTCGYSVYGACDGNSTNDGNSTCFTVGANGTNASTTAHCATNASALGFANQTDCEVAHEANRQQSIWLVAMWCGLPVVLLCGALAAVRWVPTLQTPTATYEVEEKGLKGKYMALEGVRWIAAMHIYMFHLNQTMQVGCPNCSYECRVCKFGKYEVLLFFVVSGFISGIVTFARAGPAPVTVTDAPSWSTVKTLWLKRVLPLIPLYLVSIAIGTLGSFWNRPVTADLASGYSNTEIMLRTLTMTTTWWAPFHFDVNGPAWFLENLLIFWIFTPHWMHVASMLSARGRWVALAGCWAVMWGPHLAMYDILDMPLQHSHYTNSARNFIEFSPITNVAPYIGGIVLSRMVVCTTWTWVLKKWHTVGLTLSIATCCSLMAIVEPPAFETGRHELLASKGPALFPLFAVLVVAACCTPSPDALCGGRLVALGAFGLGACAWPLYILHLPVHSVLVHVFPANPGPYYTLWIEPLIQGCFAMLCATTIDAWARKWAKSLMSGATKRSTSKRYTTLENGLLQDDPMAAVISGTSGSSSA